MLELSLVFAVAAVAGSGLTPLVIRLAAVWNIYDAPHGERRVHTQPLPRVGGVAVFLAMGVGLLAGGLASLGGLGASPERPGLFFGILFGGGIIFATGLVDDIRGLRPVAKLVAQVVAALIVYAYGFRIDTVTLGAWADIPLAPLSLPLTVLWTVGVTNAFNLIDGLDGLATGIAVVALGTTATVALTLGNAEAVVLCAALLGALIAFLRYNFNPARIFLGDSGSLFVGFMLAVLSVYGSTDGGTAVLAIIPVFALAIPLLDTTLAIVRRWLRGVPLSEADGRHIHHRLLALGLTHRHAVITLHLAAAVLAVLGLSLVFAPPPAIISVAAAGGGMTVFLLLYSLRRLQYHEFLEAGSVVASSLARMRQVIRNQIYAQDIAQVLERARTHEELGAILEDNASTFGFLHMEVCRESAPGQRPLVVCDGHASRAWRLDYPVTPHDFADGDGQVLRIWCNPHRGYQLSSAERVARLLAPVIEKWFTRPEPARVGPRLRTVASGNGHADRPPEGLAEAPANGAPIAKHVARRTVPFGAD